MGVVPDVIAFFVRVPPLDQTGPTLRSLPVGAAAPVLDADVHVLAGAHIVGDVKIGTQSSIWFGAIIRGDHTQVKIGERTNIQDLAVVHGLPGNPVQIGDGVSVGHNATIHGCTISDNCLIGIGAIVLDGAVIAPNTIVGAGAVVPGGYSGPEGVLLLGTPAKVVRSLSTAEIENIRNNARSYSSLALRYRQDLQLLCGSNETAGAANLTLEEVAAVRRLLAVQVPA